MMPKFKKAFTLIELLVVIAIIGILATIAVVSLNNARSKARDARRVADVKQIQTALDLYYNDAGHYPLNNIFASGTLFTTSSVIGTTTYMQIIPHAPTPTDGSCNVAANTYSYAVDNEGKAYNIGYCIGGPTGSMAAGYKCATPDGVFNLACAGAATSTNMVGGGGAASFNSCGDQVSYGGINYNTVQIGTQCWFAQNLNVGTMVAGGALQADVSTTSAPADFQKYCYGDLPTSCDTDGGLYQWHEAMALSSTCSNHNGLSPCDVSYPAKGICPTGWHVPSDAEWHTLELNYSTEANCSGSCYEPNNTCGCSATFNALIVNDSTHFSAMYSGLYGGYAGNAFGYRGTFSPWWSSTPFSATEATYHGISDPYYGWIQAGMSRYHFSRTNGMPIRCVHD